MTRPRVVETDEGIQGEFTVEIYDQMQRRMRDKGWIETNEIVRTGIQEGLALEVGPGPGYLGLEWLKATSGTALKGLDISADMIAKANANAAEYGLADRVEYVLGKGDDLPFDDGTFDAAFTNGSLHEWAEPARTMDEIGRVLKPGGRFFLSDLRRDQFFLVRWFLWVMTRPKEIRPGLITSLNAAYTPDEVRELLAGTALSSGTVKTNPIGLSVVGVKEA